MTSGSWLVAHGSIPHSSCWQAGRRSSLPAHAHRPLDLALQAERPSVLASQLSSISDSALRIHHSAFGTFRIHHSTFDSSRIPHLGDSAFVIPHLVDSAFAISHSAFYSYLRTLVHSYAVLGNSALRIHHSAFRRYLRAPFARLLPEYGHNARGGQGELAKDGREVTQQWEGPVLRLRRRWGKDGITRLHFPHLGVTVNG